MAMNGYVHMGIEAKVDPMQDGLTGSKVTDRAVLDTKIQEAVQKVLDMWKSWRKAKVAPPMRISTSPRH